MANDYERYYRILRVLSEVNGTEGLSSRELAERCMCNYDIQWWALIATLSKIGAVTKNLAGEYLISSSGKDVLEDKIQLSKLMTKIATKEITEGGKALEIEFDDWCANNNYEVKASKGWPDRLILSPENIPMFVEIKKSGKVDDQDQKSVLQYLAQFSEPCGNTFQVKIADYDKSIKSFVLKDVPFTG